MQTKFSPECKNRTVASYVEEIKLSETFDKLDTRRFAEDGTSSMSLRNMSLTFMIQSQGKTLS